MIDILSLALTHGLMAVAVFRLLSRDELDDESLSAPTDPAPGAGRHGKWRRARPAADSLREG